MNPLAIHPGYLQIEDQLDVVGQKYRLQKIGRGAIWIIGVTVIATLAAALAAHFIGQSVWTRVVLAAWGAAIISSVIVWFLRPMLFRPDPLEVARFIESRITGLHNGLTNGLLLARADDLSASPWLPQIFDEIAHSAAARPLTSAVKIRDLRPLAIRMMLVVVPLLLAVAIFPRPFIHGWHQLFNPTEFVPTLGEARIIEITPKDVTLVAGQPLEITLTAECPAAAQQARLIFEKVALTAGQPDGAAPANAEMAVIESSDKSAAPGLTRRQFGYRVEHLDRPMRYRVEVGGTQSPWYLASVVPQVKLTDLLLKITAPPYTRLDPKTMAIKAADLPRTPIVVAQGSRVELSAMVDVAVGGAMLQAADGPPGPMESSLHGRQFSGSITVNDDTPISILLSDGAKQIIAKLPEESLIIHCTKDAPPAIEMKWPTQDMTVALGQELKISALLRDDYGVASARVLMSSDQTRAAGDQTPKMIVAHEQTFGEAAGVKTPQPFSFVLQVDPALRKHGSSIRVQVQSTDNRHLANSTDDPAGEGPQTTSSNVFEIKFQDAEQLAKEQLEHSESLREMLKQMLKRQQDLLAQTKQAKPQDVAAFAPIASGQTDLRSFMQKTAQTFPFTPDERRVQKGLLMVTVNEAKDAVELPTAIAAEPVPAQRVKLNAQLQDRQQRIITLLEALLQAAEPTTQPSKNGSDLLSDADRFKKLDEALKEFMKQEQKILDQTAGLAKKPVDNWDDADKKLLEELKQAQDKLDAFMQEKVHDFASLAEQDLANSSMLQQLLEVNSEVTMAKDALKQKSAEVAVAAEDNGLELAKELSSNIEKWLSNSPDRTKWLQEDPLTKNDIPMPELPKELEDMVGKLMEQEEDLLDDAEDQNANWTDSADKGIGWDAADGPIADMSAKGVTGNQLPNNNEMSGRAGEGRQGKSSGEMVEDHATGKGGRRTPTRLDQTPFQKGQVKDTGSDPTGGATGGGKVSGQGGEGLEGPVPPKLKQQMQRLAQRQAEIRNAAEKLHLQYHLGRYDNFKLLESTALMRRVESDLKANRYHNAMRRRDVLLKDMDTSRFLLGSEVHVQQDSSPTMSRKTREQINDAMKGELPPAFSEALKEYYRKLSQQ